jgi:metal-responsive CopG/Arc/MetJ family transcriptional regulator
MKRLSIQLPAHLKAKLDALRGQGTTASGFIRSLLEQHFLKSQAGRKER